MVGNDSAVAVPIPYIDVPMSPHIRILHQIKTLEIKFDEEHDSGGEVGPFIQMKNEEGEIF